jgi:ribosome biogenesis protein
MSSRSLRCVLLAASVLSHVCQHAQEHVVEIEYCIALDAPSAGPVLPHKDWVSAVCRVAEGALATVSYDGAVRVWDTARPAQPTVEAALQSTPCRALASAADADGPLLVVGGYDQALLVVRPGSDSIVPVARCDGHAGTVLAAASAGDSAFASAGADSAVLLWQAGERGDPVGLSQGKRRRVASESVESLAPVASFDGHALPVAALAMPAGDVVISGSEDHSVRQLRAGAGEVSEATSVTVSGAVGAVAVAARAPDIVLAGGATRTVHVVDLRQGQAAHSLSGHTGTVSGLAWAPAASVPHFVSASHDGTLRVWDMRSSEPLHVVRVASPDEDVRCLCVAWPSARAIVAGDTSGALRTFSVSPSGPSQAE